MPNTTDVKALQADAEEGAVLVDGSGIVATLTPEAATAAARQLAVAAAAAKGEPSDTPVGADLGRANENTSGRPDDRKAGALLDQVDRRNLDT